MVLILIYIYKHFRNGFLIILVKQYLKNINNRFSNQYFKVFLVFKNSKTFETKTCRDPFAPKTRHSIVLASPRKLCFLLSPGVLGAWCVFNWHTWQRLARVTQLPLLRRGRGSTVVVSLGAGHKVSGTCIDPHTYSRTNR